MQLIRTVRWAAIALLISVAGAARAQAPAPTAPPPVLSPEELRAVHIELVETHDGFVYTVNLLGYPSEEAARKGWEQMQQPRFRLQRLDRIFKNVTPRTVTLYTVDAPLREKLANMDEGERSGPVLTARGWVIAETLSMKVAPAPNLEAAQAGIPGLVAAGTLPSAAQLQSDPALRARSIANKVRSVEDLQALPAGFDVNVKLSSVTTLLIRAILTDRPELVDALLQRGANPNLCMHRFCPLQLAVYRKAPALVDRLLKAGASANQSDPAIGVLEGPLSAAAFVGDLAVIERLIDAGASVNGQGRGETPLMAAASAGRRPVAELLLAKGADPSAVRPVGPERTAIDAAERGKHAEFAAWLRGVVLARARDSGDYAWEGWIEQDGRRHALDGKPVALRRAPFRIVVRMKPERAFYASVSSDARMIEEFRKGDPESTLLSNGNISAESPGGIDTNLVVHEPQQSGARWGGSQAWWMRSDSDTRFNSYRDTPQGREFTREVKGVVLIDAANKIHDPGPIEAYKGASMFFALGTRVHMTLMDDAVFAPRTVEIRFK